MIASPGSQLSTCYKLHSFESVITEARARQSRTPHTRRTAGPFLYQLRSAAASPRCGQNSRINRHCLAQSGSDEYNRRDGKLDRRKLRDRATTAVRAALRRQLQPGRVFGGRVKFFLARNPLKSPDSEKLMKTNESKLPFISFLELAFIWIEFALSGCIRPRTAALTGWSRPAVPGSRP
jgi:hypothetical protein